MKNNIARKKVSGVNSAKTGEAPAMSGIQVRKSVTIDRPRSELYEFWRQTENFPLFMSHVESVTILGPDRSHWRVKAPAGQTVEWDAILVKDIPGELLSWRSAADAEVENAGSVSFREAPGKRGTQVTVTLSYNPPGGRLGGFIAMLFGEEPSQQVYEDLRRFKALMETGEVPTARDRRSEETALTR